MLARGNCPVALRQLPQCCFLCLAFNAAARPDVHSVSDRFDATPGKGHHLVPGPKNMQLSHPLCVSLLNPT